MNREAQLDKLFNETDKVKFGCVMFDLQENMEGKMVPLPGSGWASIEGKKAFRISSTADLSAEVKWLTNISKEVFWKTGLVKQSKLKPSNYLRTEVTQIMKEIGITIPMVSVVSVCEALSSLFAKIMKLGIEYYGIKDFIQKDLATEIKETLVKEDKSLSIYVDEALLRSYQDIVVCNHNKINKPVKYITLKRPRYFHANQVLETKIPNSEKDWSFVGAEDMPESTKDKLKFLMAMKKPFLAKVEIKSFLETPNINLDMAKLLNLGEAIGEGGKKKERNWVCQPEILYLSQFADIEISAAFVAKEYVDLNDNIGLPYLGELSDISYSLGILSECVWIGLSARSVNKKTSSKSLVSPRACWLKSADRFWTLESAMKLSAAGFEVHTYGYGGVTVIIEDDKISQLIDFAPHAGLVVPMSLVQDKKYGMKIPDVTNVEGMEEKPFE